MAYDQDLANAERRVEQLEDVLHKIRSWCEAYPLDVFPKPDYPASREALDAAGLSLDRISADCMRHVVTKISEMIRLDELLAPTTRGANNRGCTHESSDCTTPNLTGNT